MENNSRKMISALLVLIMACFVTAGLCQLPVHASTSWDYIPYDKHDLLWSQGYGFNDFGEVVGVTNLPSTGVSVAVRLYDPEGYAILSGDRSWGHAINNEGAAVGGIITDRYRAVLWDKNDNLIDLSTDEMWGSNALDINNKNQTVGWSKDWITRKESATFWNSDGSYQVLNSPAGAIYSKAWGINDKGQIVGESDEWGFIWESVYTNPIEIPAQQNWTRLTPFDINNSGDIAGSGNIEGIGSHAFLYSYVNDQFIDLHNSVFERTFAMDINDNGFIAGMGYDEDTGKWHPLVWDNEGNMQDLAEFLPEGFNNFNITEINNKNEILGYGNHVFVLSPQPLLVEVDIDIKPGSDTNCLNNDGHGVIPVAILGSIEFDCTQVDPSSCSLEGLGLKIVGKGKKYLAHIEDVNGDGFDDLVLKIEDTDAVFQEGQTTATLTGNLYEEYGGTPIEGTDSICIVP